MAQCFERVIRRNRIPSQLIELIQLKGKKKKQTMMRSLEARLTWFKVFTRLTEVDSKKSVVSKRSQNRCSPTKEIAGSIRVVTFHFIRLGSLPLKWKWTPWHLSGDSKDSFALGQHLTKSICSYSCSKKWETTCHYRKSVWERCQSLGGSATDLSFKWK